MAGIIIYSNLNRGLIIYRKLNKNILFKIKEIKAFIP